MWRRGGAMRGLVETGLHEDEAQFGGGFEDELAVALGAGGGVEGDELVGDVTAAAGEVGDAGAEGRGRAGGVSGAAAFAEELADGIEDLGSVRSEEHTSELQSRQ